MYTLEQKEKWPYGLKLVVTIGCFFLLVFSATQIYVGFAFDHVFNPGWNTKIIGGLFFAMFLVGLKYQWDNLMSKIAPPIHPIDDTRGITLEECMSWPKEPKPRALMSLEEKSSALEIEWLKELDNNVVVTGPEAFNYEFNIYLKTLPDSIYHQVAISPVERKITLQSRNDWQKERVLQFNGESRKFYTEVLPELLKTYTK